MMTIRTAAALVCAGTLAVGAWAADGAADEKKGAAASAEAAPEDPVAAAKAAKQRAALLAQKKLYKKFGQARDMAAKVHQPVLLLVVEKGSKAAQLIDKGLVKNKLFMNDFAKKNFVVLCIEVKKDKTGELGVAKNQKNEKELLEKLFPEKIPSAYVTVLKEDLSESYFDTTVPNAPGLEQPKPDMPMQSWYTAFVAKMTSKQIPLEVSDKVKAFMESEVVEKGNGKKSRK